MSSSTNKSKKLALPAFLSMLTTGSGCTMQTAMSVAAKLYKTHNTPEQLGTLSTPRLEAMGFNAEDRKVVMNALKEAGYVIIPSTKAKPGAALAKGKKQSLKRRRDADLEEMAAGPSRSAEDEPAVLDLHFDETVDEEAIRTKSVVTNRAPVMNLWAMVVCERLGFQRAAALSISSAFTEMNAVSKGVSIGVIDKSRGQNMELTKDDTQPYIDLMGRRVAVMRSRDETYRALVKGEPVDPVAAHGYIKRAFRQTTPHVLGAMRLLAHSFSPKELNDKGYGLYAEFRPAAGQWGSRSEMKLADILDLQPRSNSATVASSVAIPRDAPPATTSPHLEDEGDGSPPAKRLRLSEPVAGAS